MPVVMPCGRKTGKSAFYETVTGVNICFCFSFWLRRMLFSAGFLFALRVSRNGSETIDVFGPASRFRTPPAALPVLSGYQHSQQSELPSAHRMKLGC